MIQDRLHTPSVFAASIVAAALSSLTLGACGGDDPLDAFAGLYEVSSHTRNDTACDAEGPAVTDFTHFILRKENFLGQEFLSMSECTGATEDTCDDVGIFSSFIEEGDRIVQRITFSSGGGTLACSLGMTESVLTDDDAGGIRIDTQTFGEEDPTLSEDVCEPEEAERRGTSMPCESLEVVIGAPI